MRNRLCFREIS